MPFSEQIALKPDLARLRRVEQLRHIREAYKSKVRQLKDERRCKEQHQRRADNAEAITRSRIANFVIEGMRDKLVDELLAQAMANVRTIREQTLEDGSYMIRITVPELHIQDYIGRHEMGISEKPWMDQQVRVIQVGPKLRRAFEH